MGRAPCCDKANVKRGPWSPEEDAKLKEYIEKNGTGGNWISLPQKAGLRRCGKSCRLRWLNYLRPNIKHGDFSDDEDRIICTLFANIGSRWSIIAAQLPGRTDNDIKNYWNTKLKKKLMGAMVTSSQQKPHPTTTYPSISYEEAYKCGNINTTFYEPNISTPSNISQVGPMQYFQVNDSNVLMFGGGGGGGGEASCSTSSDGSCNNNQIIRSNGRERLDHVDHYGVSIDGSYNIYNGVNQIDQNQKFMLSSGGDSRNGYLEKENGYYGETAIDYTSLEDIKQLISTGNNFNNLNFFVDENKTAEEKVLY